MHAMNNERSRASASSFHRHLTWLAGSLSLRQVIRNGHPFFVQPTHEPGPVLSFESKYTHRFNRSCAPRRQPCR